MRAFLSAPQNAFVTDIKVINAGMPSMQQPDIDFSRLMYIAWQFKVQLDLKLYAGVEWVEVGCSVALKRLPPEGYQQLANLELLETNFPQNFKRTSISYSFNTAFNKTLAEEI